MKNTPDENALKCCPFCGGEHIKGTEISNFADYIRHTQECFLASYEYIPKRWHEAWNTRHKEA